MVDLKQIECRLDNGGRRLGCDRRQFSYAVYLPERRTGKDRRSGDDRRSLWDFGEKMPNERRFLTVIA